MEFRELFILAACIACKVQAGSFCTDSSDYECKHLGITKCVPKSNRSIDHSKPLPIEKPPCALACPDHHTWCEERGTCLGHGEVCDCAPDKIYCSSINAEDGDDSYSCEARQGILQSNIFNICQDGTCQRKCKDRRGSSAGEEKGKRGLVAELLRMEECGVGHFMCGTTCLENSQIVEFRTCEGDCISVHQTCFKAGEIESDNRTINIVYIIIPVVILISIIIIFLIQNFFKKEKDNVNRKTSDKDENCKIDMGTPNSKPIYKSPKDGTSFVLLPMGLGTPGTPANRSNLGLRNRSSNRKTRNKSPKYSPNSFLLPVETPGTPSFTSTHRKTRNKSPNYGSSSARNKSQIIKTPGKLTQGRKCLWENKGQNDDVCDIEMLNIHTGKKSTPAAL